MSVPDLRVFVDVPEAFAPRAVWTLQTLLAPMGRTPAVTRDPAEAGDSALAYAVGPVNGVPTIPCDVGAMDLIAAERALPPGAFSAAGSGDGAAVAAWPADPGAGFAVHYDLIASAFVLLACWDERTTGDRDQYGRLPYSSSAFAANPALTLEEPAVDRYVEVLRAVLSPRLDELGLEPLAAAGDVWGARGRFAIALTHDLDNLWRWTPRGLAAAGYRAARAARHLRGRAVLRELGDTSDWLVRHLPRHTDPSWTFPQILEGEDVRGVSSTFYVIARHTHRQDGNQPASYRRRAPEVLSLLGRHHREIGLHGNDADRLGVDPLVDDRGLLAREAHAEIHGIRYHYLRCLYHETLPLLEQAGFSYDTSLAFAEREGYRCGCSFPFRPYSLAEERPLDLVELPLAVMDGTLQQPHYRGLPAVEAERVAASVLGRILRSGGAASLLWHNNRFDKRMSRGYDKVYWNLVDQALARGGWLASAGEIVGHWRQTFGMPEPSSSQATGTTPCDRRLDATRRTGG